MKKTNVLVIGGSAAGIVAALTGKSHYPDKDFILIRKEKEVLVPCGIPYIFGSLEGSSQNIIPDAKLKDAGIKLIIDEVVLIDSEKKFCRTAKNEEIGFEKLVIATGSNPVVPKWLKGTGLEDVFTVPKDKVYIDKVINRLQDAKNIIVIGGGFIGVEISDELNKRGKKVTIVELLPHILGSVFDDEIAVKAQEVLINRGVNIKAGVGVKEIKGEVKVSGVILQNGDELEADAIILSVGYKPNVTLAEKSGLKINSLGFIKVNEYMKTTNPSIFAIGDCAEKKDFITRKSNSTMLASTACAEARIVGMNLYKLSTVKTFSGTIAIFSTAFGENAFGIAGITEKTAREEDFDIVTGAFEGVDRHPGKLPGMHKQTVKLIATREAGVILGGSVVGGISTGELVNIIGFAIQNNMSLTSILTAQIGTHPLLTSPPTAYPLIKAAEIAVKKIRNGNNISS